MAQNTFHGGVSITPGPSVPPQNPEVEASIPPVHTSPSFGYLPAVPLPGTSGSSFFEGINITAFLNRYEDMCLDYHISHGKKIRRLPRYCTMMLGTIIETLKNFKELRWERLKVTLKKEFKSGDSLQQINSRAFLKNFKSKVRTADDDIRNYCRQFQSISGALIERGKMDEYTRLQWFMQGLPRKLCEELFFRKKISLDEDEMTEFDEVIRRTLRHLENDRRMREMLKVDRDTSLRFSAMIDSFDTKVKIAAHDDVIGAMKSSMAPNPSYVTSETSDKVIQALTKKMEAMVLANVVKPPVQYPIQPSSEQEQEALPEPGTHAYARAHGLCTFCHMVDREDPNWHDLRDHDSMFKTLIENGDIHLNEKGLIAFGPSGGYALFLRMVRGVTPKENVRRALAALGRTMFTPKVNSMKIAELSDDDSSEDEWDSEIIIYSHPEVNAGRLEDKKSNVPGAWRELVNRIIKRKVETENKYPAPKAPRYGNWQSPTVVPERKEDENLLKEMQVITEVQIKVSGVGVLSLPFITTKEEEKDTEMQDALDKRSAFKTKFQGIREQKELEAQEMNPSARKTRLLFTAEKEFDLDIIQERFLRQYLPGGSGLTNGNMIATLFMFRSVVNRVNKEASETKAWVKSGTNYKVASIGVRDKALRKAYMRATPKAKVQVAGGAMYKALFDIGAEVNVMTQDIVKAEGLFMRSYPDINLVSHNGARRSFFGVCEDVEIVIGGVKGLHHIFVIDAADHRLVLGQPFLLQMRVELTYKDNDVKCALHQEDGGRSVEFIVVTNTEEKMRFADELFFNNFEAEALN